MLVLLSLGQERNGKGGVVDIILWPKAQRTRTAREMIFEEENHLAFTAIRKQGHTRYSRSGAFQTVGACISSHGVTPT